MKIAKRFLFTAVFAFLVVFLTACSVQSKLDNIFLKYKNGQVVHGDIPLKSKYGRTKLSWKSSNPQVISNTGLFTPVFFNDDTTLGKDKDGKLIEEAVVTLTAHDVKNAKKTYEYKVKVKKYTPQETFDYLIKKVPAIIDGQKLDTKQIRLPFLVGASYVQDYIKYVSSITGGFIKTTVVSDSDAFKIDEKNNSVIAEEGDNKDFKLTFTFQLLDPKKTKDNEVKDVKKDVAIPTFKPANKNEESYKKGLQELLDKITINKEGIFEGLLILEKALKILAAKNYTYEISYEGDVDTNGILTKTKGTAKVIVKLLKDNNEVASLVSKKLSYKKVTEAKAIYRSAVGPGNTLNFHATTQAEDSALFDILLSSLYDRDIDWQQSIGKDKPTSEADFAKSSLFKWKWVTSCAAEFPENKGDNVWHIKLRKDLKFDDGTPITADDYIYSWFELINPKLNNKRAQLLYDATEGIRILNAEDYFKQGTVKKEAEGSNPAELWPEVAAEKVGIKKVDNYTIAITVDGEIAQTRVIEGLTTNILSPVKKDLYEDLKNKDKTKTEYGTDLSKFVGTGIYRLVSWQKGVQLIYEKNQHYFDKAVLKEYVFENIVSPVITDHELAYNEFMEGRLDRVGILGKEKTRKHENDPRYKQSPTRGSFRYIINGGEREDGKYNHALRDFVELRQAIYFAIDRKELCRGAGAPNIPEAGLLTPLYRSSKYNKAIPYIDPTYATHEYRKEFDQKWSQVTSGYNQEKALELFAQAYAKAQTNPGKYLTNGKITFSITYFDVPSNQSLTDEIKKIILKSLKAEEGGENASKLAIEFVPLALDAFNEQVRTKNNFDLSFSGWQLDPEDPAGSLLAVYNSNNNYYQEGFKSADFVLDFEVPEKYFNYITTTYEAKKANLNKDIKVIIDKFIANYDATTKHTKVTLGELSQLNDCEAIFGYTVEAEAADYDKFRIIITVAIENTLLDNMICIPLFASQSSFIHSAKTKYLFKEFNPVFLWGGLKYIKPYNWKFN